MKMFGFLLSLLLVKNLAVQAGRVIVKQESDHNVVSPNFPKQYPPNTDIEWRFSSAYGQWTVIYKVLDIEWSKSCEKDQLDIYDGDLSVTKISKRFCNKLFNPTSFLSTGNTVRIHFRSDGDGQSKGFHLEVVHVTSEEDYRKMMSKRQQEAASITIIDGDEEKPDIFIALVASLSIVGVIFVVLLIYLIISISHRRRKARDRLMDIKPHPLFEAAAVDPGSGRRYTRQLSTESNPQTAGNNKMRHSFPQPRTGEPRSHPSLHHQLSYDIRHGPDPHVGYNSYI